MIRDHLSDLSGKNVGLVMNPTARVGSTHVLDTLLALSAPIKALFAPEHGFRGQAGAGERIVDGIDSESGLPVFSLYGKTKKPTSQMLDGVDLLIFDMQDVGVRFYTYISTLGLVLEAAAENKVEVWVLDRPNPLGGDYVSGWMLQPEHKSFVGAFPIPIAHGLTMGEIALMMAGEGWLNGEVKPKVKVIQMENWSRTMRWPDTGLEWMPPSPNLPRFENALVYAGTCLIEGTDLSEGRGTAEPFLTIGAPGLTVPEEMLTQLSEKFNVELRASEFTPISIPGKSKYPKHQDNLCTGIQIRVPDVGVADFQPVEFGHELLAGLLAANPQNTTSDFIYKLAGNSAIDGYLKADKPKSPDWLSSIKVFRDLRRPYLIYQ